MNRLTVNLNLAKELLRHWMHEAGESIQCDKATECYRDDRTGWLAFEDPENNAAGGCWFAHCSCASSLHHKTAKFLMEPEEHNVGPVQIVRSNLMYALSDAIAARVAYEMKQKYYEESVYLQGLRQVYSALIEGWGVEIIE